VSEGPALTVAAVARRLGVAPATLRTWDRRYGLGPSAHTAGRHRRYDAVDLARLGVMRRLTLDGVTPAEAAGVALSTDVSATGHLATVSAPVLSTAGTEADGPPTADIGRHEEPLEGAGIAGGRVLPLPGGSPAARGLARAAMALDSAAAARIVTRALAERGVIPTWTDVVAPVLIGIGQRWATTGTGVDVEHLLAESVLGSLRTVRLRAAPVNVRPILLACVPDDQHSLPLHALAAALAERQVATRVLGARVPTGALAAAVRRTGPIAVFVWAQMPGYGDRKIFDRLPVLRPASRLVLGGPGWHGVHLPDGVAHVDDLGSAVERVSAAVLA
jgi:MerR family transcriptional regulator, light-induced transcriptional regulator